MTSLMKRIKFAIYKLSLIRLCPKCLGISYMIVSDKELHCKNCGIWLRIDGKLENYELKERS